MPNPFISGNGSKLTKGSGCAFGRPPISIRRKDADRDGIPNRWDCRPYDATRQGLILDIKEGIKRRRNLRAVREQAYKEQQVRESAKTGKYRATQEGKIQRRYVKPRGGILEYAGSVKTARSVIFGSQAGALRTSKRKQRSVTIRGRKVKVSNRTKSTTRQMPQRTPYYWL